MYKTLSKSTVSFLLLILGTAGIFQTVAQAQNVPVENKGEVSRQALQSLLEMDQNVSQFRTRQLADGLFDTDWGVMRARYRIDYAPVSWDPERPEHSARAFLASEANLFGMEASLDDLKELDIVSTSYSHHVVYQQMVEGLPVYDRYIQVNMTRQGRITMVSNGYASHLAKLSDADLRPAISEETAEEEVRDIIEQPISRFAPIELMVYPSVPSRLVWRTVVWTESPDLELEVLVDAKNGEIVSVKHLSTHAHSIDFTASLRESETSVKRAILNQKGDVVQSKLRATGTGFVFDPDPLSSSGQFYGLPYVDNDDADNLQLNDERILIELNDIMLGSDGFYRLTGPNVQIVGESAGGSINYTPPAESSPDGFRYTRSNDFFEAVNVYYHIDKSQRYIQSLNIGRDIQRAPIRVNPHGLGLEDNSRYFSTQNFIAFGIGGVDDAEDAHVIWHEYGHALLQGSAPGLLNSSEGQALHEGWADYWAASYARSLVEENAVLRDDWDFLFKWDSGDGTIWSGRKMNFNGKYPDDVFCDEGGIQCDIYTDGLLWASTLMQIYDELGREQTDRMSLASHIYLSYPVTFRDAAEAIIQADADLNDGMHIDFLIQLFNEKGLIRLDTFGPLVVHNPIAATEQLGGFIPVEVEATGISSPIDRVFVVYSHSEAFADTLFLEPMGEEIYTGLLPLPNTPGEVTYYIGVLDQLGLFVKNPKGSTNLTYSFTVGPDTQPPTINHVQLSSVSLIEWPATVSARVEDNLGVDSVQVDYYIDGPFGNQIDEGVFGLTEVSGEYRGAFPTSLELLQPGSSVFYRLIAIDRSQEVNTSFSPEEGFYGFNIIIEGGLFREYDFESEISGLISSGSWQRDKPAYGTRIAHSKEYVWATNPKSTYSSVPQQSALTLPSMNLQEIEKAYLVFWHWYDTEHAGGAVPGGDSTAILWDGGNIKISIDDGATWNVLRPETGYNGYISGARSNPLEGEPAFGGFSYGWRQVIAPLPVGNTLQIRFDFGTDEGNANSSVGFAGWYIDDISIVTEIAADTSAPRVLELPDPVLIRGFGDAVPPPFLQITDDVGIASVYTEYVLEKANRETEMGQFRMAMDSTRLDSFSGSFPFSPLSIAVGDVIEYRFAVSDFAGNTAIYPEVSLEPLRIEFRLQDVIDMLSEAQSTGLWRFDGDIWNLEDREDHEPVSSLVFGPLDLPLNVDDVQLYLSFYQLIEEGHGGNVKISTDQGEQWDIITPVEGYNGELPGDETVPEAMREQQVFTGRIDNTRQVAFDLVGFKGEQIWLRVDFASLDRLSMNEFWRISEATIRYSTLEVVDGGFDIPRTFTLHGNYPDPFHNTTTISYTLEAPTPVLLEVYDMLGRRISILEESEKGAGSYSLSFDGSSLSSGLYLLRLETNQGQQIERLIVSR